MSSIIFIVCSLLFICAFSVVISEKTENIVEAAIVSAAYLFCVVGIIGAIYEVLHIPVYLPTICAGLGSVDFIFVIVFFKKRKTSFIIPKIDKKDVKYLISVCVLSGFVLFMCLYHFGVNLKLTYGDVDSVRYLTMAMDIVKNHTVTDEFVTPLWISIFIQLIQSIQLEVFLYRGMILGNICMQILVAVFFFVLANKVNRHRNVINTIITILFWCGYQLYILSYGTFLHWEDGMLLIMFIIYHIMIIWERQDNLKYGIASCLAGTLTLALCYPFFGIILIVLILPEIIVWIAKNRKQSNILRWEKIVFVIVIVIGGIIGFVFMRQRVPNLNVLFENFSTEGLAYKEPYMDFIFFAPMVILHMLLMIKEKYLDDAARMVLRMNIVVALFIIFWWGFYVKGYLSNYYLYRNYYVLWLLAWLVMAQTIGMLIEKKQELLVAAYATLYGLCILVSVIGVDEKIYSYNSDLYLDNPSNRTMTPFYSFNFKSWSKTGRNVIGIDMINIYQYRIENLKNEWVPMISSQWKALDSQWYSAICALCEKSDVVDVEKSSFINLSEWLEVMQASYVLIDKTDPVLQAYVPLMDNFWNIEVETEQATLYKKPVEARWSRIKDGFEKESDESIEFENYARMNYGYNNVMLLCEGTYGGQGDVNEYRAYEGESTVEYVGKFEPETFLECTYIFNNDGVEYLSVYKDSELYLQNQQYFDSQKILFENDLAMIVTFNGTGWMPSQQ